MNSTHFTDNIIEYAGEALKKPEDFYYNGPEDMFKTWGYCGIDKHRDSTAIDVSNFEVISKDLITNYPDDFRVETYTHWLVGSVDRLVCRVLKNESMGLVGWNITDAFISAMCWKNELKDYPIADEDNYEQLRLEYGDDSFE